MLIFQSAKHEVNVPVLKNFVEMMYTPIVDLTTKRKQAQVCLTDQLSFGIFKLYGFIRIFCCLLLKKRRFL